MHRMTSPSEISTIVLVDDDTEIRTLVSDYLKGHGLNVLTAGDGVELRRLLAAHSVDLAVLDIMLPGEDGLSLCRFVREERNLPVILLTALGEESDRVVGLEMGADDYLTKPFSTRELLARIRAVLRRAGEQLPVHQLAGAESYRFDGWRLLVHRRELFDPNDVLISLTGGEMDLLIAFSRNPGRILNRDQLLEMTKGRQAQAFDRSIDVQLSRLRKKLGNPDFIKTVRGGGYLFTPQVSVS